MKYLKLFEQFLITESLNIPPVPKTVHVNIILKNSKISENWDGTIFENFDEAYKFCKEFDKNLEFIRQKFGSKAKEIICQQKHKDLWNLLGSTADHQVHILREKYPAGMPPLDPEIGQSSILMDKIQKFLDSKPPKYILDDKNIKDFLKEKISDLPTHLFYQEVGKFADKILSEQPGSPDDGERKEKLVKFIGKVKMHNWEQRTSNKWDDALVRKDPNYPKTQEIFSFCRKWFDYCKDGGPPKFKDKDDSYSYISTKTSNSNDSESDSESDSSSNIPLSY